jgi:hypothetical protein
MFWSLVVGADLALENFPQCVSCWFFCSSNPVAHCHVLYLCYKGSEAGRRQAVRLGVLELRSVWVRILAQLPITLISIELIASITKIDEEPASGPVTEKPCWQTRTMEYSLAKLPTSGQEADASTCVGQTRTNWEPPPNASHDQHLYNDTPFKPMTFPLTKEDINLILHALQLISDDAASLLRERLLSHYFQQAAGGVILPGLDDLSNFGWCCKPIHISRPTLHQSVRLIHMFRMIRTARGGVVLWLHKHSGGLGRTLRVLPIFQLKQSSVLSCHLTPLIGQISLHGSQVCLTP